MSDHQDFKRISMLVNDDDQVLLVSETPWGTLPAQITATNRASPTLIENILLQDESGRVIGDLFL